MFVPFERLSPLGRLAALGALGTGALGAWLALHGRNPVIPSPAEVAAAWARLLREGLLARLAESYALNLQGLALSTAVAFGGAYLSVVEAVRPAARLLSRMRFLGMTGVTFALGMYLSGRALQVAVLAFGVTVFYLTAMLAVVAAVPPEELDHARSLRMGPWRVTWEVVVRGTLDQALDVLRQNAAMGWMMLTLVEGLVRSEGGVGVLLLDRNRRLDLAGVFAIQGSILLVGVAQDFALGRARAALCPYGAPREA